MGRWRCLSEISAGTWVLGNRDLQADERGGRGEEVGIGEMVRREN